MLCINTRLYRACGHSGCHGSHRPCGRRRRHGPHRPQRRPHRAHRPHRPCRYLGRHRTHWPCRGCRRYRAHRPCRFGHPGGSGERCHQQHGRGHPVQPASGQHADGRPAGHLIPRGILPAGFHHERRAALGAALSCRERRSYESRCLCHL